MSAHEQSYQLETSRWNTGRNVLFFAALVCIVGCVAGYLENPERFFRSYLVAFAYTCAVGLGAFFFVMIQFLTGAAWSVTVRRIMENIMFTLPFGALLFIPIAFGLDHIYAWTNPAVIPHEVSMAGKAWFLTPNFFILRTYGYFLVWSIWIFALYRQSTKQDTEKSIKQMHIASRWSAPGLFLVIAVGTLASYDWLMSLEPTWYSTIFGLYFLSGGALTFFSIVTLVAMGFRRAGLLKHAINIEHYHDLGKWIFAMTAFYTYIAFSQYILIWYLDLSELWKQRPGLSQGLWPTCCCFTSIVILGKATERGPRFRFRFAPNRRKPSAHAKGFSLGEGLELRRSRSHYWSKTTLAAVAGQGWRRVPENCWRAAPGHSSAG